MEDDIQESRYMNSNLSNKVIVVLGAGRCGTSLVMQILSRLGMSVSESLVPAKAHNPEGPMEDQDLANIYDNFLLPKIGSKRFLPLPSNIAFNEFQNSLQKKFEKILVKNINTSNTIWGFKDPFTSIILPVWFSVFNSASVTPIFLVSVRDPAHSAVSRFKHFSVDKSTGELAWLVNYCDALHHTAADCFIIHYEDWFSRPVDLAQELLSYTGLDQYFTGNIDKAIKGFVKPNLNRAVYEEYEVQNECVRKLYAVLKDCRGNEFDRERLMAVVKECRNAMNGFKGWYMEAQKYIGQQAQTRGLLDKERARTEELELRLVKEQEIKKNEILQLAHKKGVLEQEKEKALKENQEQLKHLSEELNQSRKRFEEQNKEIQSLYEQPLLEKDKRIAAMQVELHDIIVENNKYLKQLKDLSDELHGLRSNLSSMQNELAQVKQEKEKTLKENKDQLKGLHDEQENLRIRMRSIQNELSEINKAKTALEQTREKEQKEKQGQLTQAQAEVNNLRKELERVSALEQETEKTLKEKQDQLAQAQAEVDNLKKELGRVSALEQAREKELKENQGQLRQAQAEVDNLRKELERASALEQAREKKNHQALQQKEMVHHYRQFIKRLYTLIMSLEKDYFAIKNSYTWRVGDFLVRGMELLLFRKKRPLATDHLERIFQEYRAKMPVFEPDQKELAQFKKWVKQIEKDFIDLFASKRWKVGNGFVFIIGGTRFSRKKSTARDHIDRILKHFEEENKDKNSIKIPPLEPKQFPRQIDSEDNKKADSHKGGRRVSKPKISVIIPVFNKREYVESCINSLFQKEYENLEVICVNDASKDGSESILQTCVRNDSRVRVFSHKDNSGASVARNTGISLSDGKYLFFLDADDIIAENALAEMAEIAEEQHADIVRGKITGIMPDGSNRQLAAEHLLHTGMKYRVKWAEEESLWFYWYFTANLYNAQFIKKNRIIFPRNMRNEDPFFLCRCFLAAENICLYPDITYYYRIGAEQAKKTPSLSFLTGWSMGNYYLYQLFQTQYVQSQYFMLHFPSLLAHSQNTVKHLDREAACGILKYINLIFSHANMDYYTNPNSQPWTRKRRLDKKYIDYVQVLQSQPLEKIYDYLAR